MAAIPGQPAPKPGGLAGPVPGAAEAKTAQDLLSQFEAPSLEAAPQEQPTGGAADLLAQFAAPTPEAVPEEQFAPEPGFLQANVDQFSNFVTRLQSGLAANDTEKLNFLKKKFGDNNATIKDGDLYFRKAETDKFQRLDPGTFELLNDIIPDWSREIIQELAMLPGEAAGALAVGPAGAVGGRALSVPVANAIADKVAESAGVPQDEGRSKLTENLVGSAAEAVLPVVGKGLVKPILKKLPGTRAYEEAIKAGDRELVALSKQSTEVAKSVEALNELGKSAKINGEIVGIPGAEVNLMGHQMNPDSPILQRFANQAANDPRFVNAQNQLAEDWGAALENTLREVGRRGNNGPLRPEMLAESVTNAVEDTIKAEGQAIGKYKAKAMAKLKNQAQPLAPEVAQRAQELMQTFGFRAGQSGKILPPKDLKSLVGKMGTTSVGEVRAIVNNLEVMSKGLQKGLRIDELDALRNNIGSTGSRLYKTEAGAKLSALSGDLRQQYRNTISSGLEDDFERAAFNSTMDEFSQLKMNVAMIKEGLNGDASSKAIVKTFFTGKENLQKIKAIRRISPESFGHLKEEFVNQLISDYASRETKTGFKSSQFLDAVNKKYGDEFLNEVFKGTEGPGLKEVKQLLTVTERIESTFKKVKADTLSEEQKKGMMNLVVGLAADVKFKTLNGLSALIKGRLPRDHALYEVMTQKGFDKYVADYPGKIDRRSTLRKLNDMLADIKVYRAVEAAGAETVKRGTKQYIRGEAQQIGGE